MTRADVDVSAPTTVGAEASAGTRSLPDRDVVDEHRLRRRRLSTSIRSGGAALPSGAGVAHVVGGVLLAATALGGTAVAAVVHSELLEGPASPASAGGAAVPATSSSTPTVPGITPTPTAPTAPPTPSGADAAGANTFGDAIPYGPVQDANSQTTR